MAYPPSSEQYVKAWLDAGLAAHHQGDIERALDAYRHVLTMAPDHGPALNLLGTGLLQLGQAAEAVPYLERAARRQRDEPELLANLAQAYLVLERFAEAGETFRKASRLAPGQVQFQVGVAAALAMQGKLAEAETMLQRLTARFPRSALVWFNFGNVMRDRQRPDAAIAAYERALALEPAHADAHNALGSVLHGLQRFGDAEKHYRECLRAAPDHRLAQYNLASVVIDLGRFSEAEAICRELITAEPDSAEAHMFLGAALGHQGRVLESLVPYERAARLSPGTSRAAASYGANLVEVGRVAEGLRWLSDAIDIQREDEAPHQLLSTALLARCILQDGWREYLLRPAALRLREKYQDFALARALPDDLSARAVCVLREQGLGDEIFFLRYTRVLASRGARVTYRTSNKIASLLSRAPFISQVVDESAPPPPADLYIMVGDLPHALGATPLFCLTAREQRRAAMAEFPFRASVYWPPVPDSIHIEPLSKKLDSARARLAALGPPPYIGLTWRAGTAPEEQTSVSWMLYKEIAIEALARAVKGAGGTFLALQRKPAAGELERVAQALGRPLHDLTALNEDLEDMLALLALIDEYVGVSNTNMHLRAAAGRTARVLVPVPAEWRWLQYGRSSPWFPGFRIYRQSLQGTWEAALEELKADLEKATEAPAQHPQRVK